MRPAYIEVIPNLRTNSCRNSIMRFIAGRGEPNTIITENWTFLYLKKIAEYVAAWKREGSEEYLIQRRTRWKFNTLEAPHFRGVSEWFASNSNKAMYAVSVKRSVTEEVLSTRMFSVVQTLNARQLNPISSNVNWLEALNSNQFWLATITFAYPTYKARRNLLIIEISFDKLKPMQIYGECAIGKNGDLRSQY